VFSSRGQCDKEILPRDSERREADNDFLGQGAILSVSSFEGPTVMFRAFTDHPETVGETYLEHMGSAWGFAGGMLVGAAACFLHGLLPFAFQKAGSRRIAGLYDRMVKNRHRHAPPVAETFLGIADGI